MYIIFYYIYFIFYNISILYITLYNIYKIKPNKKERPRGICQACSWECAAFYNYHGISRVFGHKSSGLNFLASFSVSL